MSTIELNTKNLREAADAVSRVIQRSPSDIMESLLISCGQDRMVHVRGSSAHAELSVELHNHDGDPFAIAVNAERFRQVLSRATSEHVKLTPDADGKQVKIVGGNVRSTLNLLQAGDYPAFYEPAGEPIFDVEMDIAHVFGETVWATGSGAHLKPYCQGPNIVVTKGEAKRPAVISVLCTTGAVLARVLPETDMEDVVSKDYFVTVPMLSAKMLAQVFKRAGISAYQNRLIVEAAGFRMGVPYIMQGDGEPVRYPPVTAKGELKVRREHLLDAVKACAAVSDLSKVSTVSIKRDGDVLKVSANGRHGSIEETVDVESGPGAIDRTFASTQLANALSATSMDVLTIDGESPIRLRGGHWEALIMPFKM